MQPVARLGLFVVIPVLAGVAAWVALRSSGIDEDPARGEERPVAVAGEGPTLQGRRAPGRVAVPRGTLAIRGVAKLSYGKPAAGARVTASLDQVGEVVRGAARPDGSYALEGLAAGLYLVEAVWTEGEIEYGARGYVSAGELDYAMELTRRPRTLVVRVLTPAGDPVPRFDARLLLPAGLRGLGVRSEGQVRLEVGLGLTQESVSDLAGACLELWAARDQDDFSLGLAPQRVGPLAGNEREVEVRLVAGPTIEGRVLGPDGSLGQALSLEFTVQDQGGRTGPDMEELLEQFLPGEGGEKRPKLAPSARPLFVGLRTRVKTGADGAFRIAYIFGDRPHVLTLQTPEGFLPPSIPPLQPGDGALEIRLAAAASARVTVLGPDGKPWLGAQVTAAPELTFGSTGEDPASVASTPAFQSARSANNMPTDDTGVALLSGLDPRVTYRLTAKPSVVAPWMRNLSDAQRSAMGIRLPPKDVEAPPMAGSVTVKGWQPADTVLRLPTAFSLMGVVVDELGQPADGAQVSLEHVGADGAEHDWQSDSADAQGRFRFEGLGKGTVTLTAESGGAGGASGGYFGMEAATMFPAEAVAPEAGVPAPGPPALGPHQARITLTGDVSGVSLRIPVSHAVTLRLAPEPKRSDAKPADLLRGLFSGAALVQVLRKTDTGWQHAATTFFDPTAALRGKESTAEVKGLEAGPRYAVWIEPKDGRYVYEEFDAKVGALVLTRREGGVITGRVLGLPPGATHALIRLQDERGRSVSNIKTNAEGQFEVRGLPLSVWEVHATYELAGAPSLVGEGRASTGGSVDLRLTVAREPPRFPVVPAPEGDR